MVHHPFNARPIVRAVADQAAAFGGVASAGKTNQSETAGEIADAWQETTTTIDHRAVRFAQDAAPPLLIAQAAGTAGPLAWGTRP